MGRPRSAPPVWPQTFLTPTHDLRIHRFPMGRGEPPAFSVCLAPKYGTENDEVTVASHPDPIQAMQRAAEVLMDAALTLRRALRRIQRGPHQATVPIVTPGVDKNV